MPKIGVTAPKRRKSNQTMTVDEERRLLSRQDAVKLFNGEALFASVSPSIAEKLQN